MLSLRCILLREVFEGGAPDDPRSAEWPPSWMRLFSALVSVAEPGSSDDDVLRLLESAPPPAIHAAPASRWQRRTYVPTNAILSETKHTNLPGRTNGERLWARAAPRSPEIWYRWGSLAPSGDELARLAQMCRRVPYLGRSTSPALVEIVADTGPPDGWLEPLVDVPAGTRVSLAATVRSPYPGALDALRAAYDERFRLGEAGDPWQIGQGIDYGSMVVEPTAQVVAGPYPTMVVLRLTSRALDGRHAARVTHAVRRALLSRAEEHIAVLHGHHAGDVVQVAFLGLVDVGHRHADGHLLGVGIALPELASHDLGVVADALPSPSERFDVTAGPLGQLTLLRTSPLDASGAWGLQPRRWSSGATRWASVTPVVLDRFPGGEGALREEVRHAARNAHLPEPDVLHVSRDAVVEGAPRFAPPDTLRRPGDRVIPYRHVVLEFPERVAGPVVLGSMRHYGLGLCVPLGEASRDGA